jgi:hypothetical protein
MTGYVITHEDKAFDPNGRVALSRDQIAEHNARLERAELERWKDKPGEFAAYVKASNVTTWLGTTIGVIVARNEYRNNLGAKIESITVRGNNGATYYGRYGCDWSQLVRLRRTKV